MRWQDIFRVDVPEGVDGDWKVERFTVTPQGEAFERMRACNPSSRGRYVPAGVYTSLKHFGACVMSDTPDECRDILEPHLQAQRRGGHVLLNGLGLGVLLQGILALPNVEQVTVVELSPEVVRLVVPHYQAKFGDRFHVVRADALTWSPPKGTRFTVVWHDIWSDICGDHLPEMHRLHRRYGRRCDWQGSWCRGLLED